MVPSQSNIARRLAIIVLVNAVPRVFPCAPAWRALLRIASIASVSARVCLRPAAASPVTCQRQDNCCFRRNAGEVPSFWRICSHRDGRGGFAGQGGVISRVSVEVGKRNDRQIIWYY